MNSTSGKTVFLTTSALLLALLSVSSYLQIPTPWGIPFTLQTLVIMLISLLLPVRWGSLVIGGFLLAGILGLPVFSRGASGAAFIAGPTGGFLAGFTAAPLCSGIVLYRAEYPLPLRKILASALAALFPIYSSGILWLVIGHGMSFTCAVKIALLPFIPFALLKIAILVPLYRVLETRFKARPQ